MNITSHIEMKRSIRTIEAAVETGMPRITRRVPIETSVRPSPKGMKDRSPRSILIAKTEAMTNGFSL